MDLIILAVLFIAYKLYKYYQDNKSVGCIDWEKYNYYAYHKHLSQDELTKLMRSGFFTDQKRTAEFLKRHPDGKL